MAILRSANASSTRTELGRVSFNHLNENGLGYQGRQHKLCVINFSIESDAVLDLLQDLYIRERYLVGVG